VKTLALTLCLCVLFVAPATADPRSDCAGYPQARILYTTESYWTPASGFPGSQLGVIEMGTCWPHHKTVSGDFVVPFQVTFENQIGTVTQIKTQDDTSVDFIKPMNLHVDTTVTPDQSFTSQITVDTTKVPDGLRQFRIYVYLSHPDGSFQRTKAMYRVRVENVPGTADDVGPKYPEYGGAGWFIDSNGKDWGYQVTDVEPKDFPRIRQCFSGTWSPHVNADHSGTTEHDISVDPDEGGPVLTQSSTQGFEGAVHIDTTTLTNGWHELESESGISDGTHTNAGVFVLPFRVCN